MAASSGLRSAVQIGCRTHRRLSSVAPSARARAEMPSFVSERLQEIQMGILSQIVPSISSSDTPNAGSAPSSSHLGRLAAFPTTSRFQTDMAEMARYYFDQGGKLFRPTVALLMAAACNRQPGSSSALNDIITENQIKIAMIAEMIHVASLVHDDVIDESDKRRGGATVNAVWGNKMAVLVGDFILARATQLLTSIGRPHVISIMAGIIEDLVMGEFMQMNASGASTSASRTLDDRVSEYMQKTYHKTASLFANTCRSVAMLAEVSRELEDRAWAYGRHLGLAFQLVDDLLDFEESAAQMGKPVAVDLKLGLATGPVLFAAEKYPELIEMMERRFSGDGDPDAARKFVLKSRGIELTRRLVQRHCEQAAEIAESLPNADGAASMLVELAMRQVERRV